MLSKGPPTAIVKYKYLAFKGATNAATVICKYYSLKGPKQQRYCVSTTLSKGSHYHLQCACKEKFPTNFYTEKIMGYNFFQKVLKRPYQIRANVYTE